MGRGIWSHLSIWTYLLQSWRCPTYARPLPSPSLHWYLHNTNCLVNMWKNNIITSMNSISSNVSNRLLNLSGKELMEISALKSSPEIALLAGVWLLDVVEGIFWCVESFNISGEIVGSSSLERVLPATTEKYTIFVFHKDININSSYIVSFLPMLKGGPRLGKLINRICGFTVWTILPAFDAIFILKRYLITRRVIKHRQFNEYLRSNID